MKNAFRLCALCALMLLGSTAAFAQYVPTHPKYVTYIQDGKSFFEYFPTWEPGKPLSEDENFFISRVKMKPRFINRNTQVIPDDESNNQRKFSLCTPMGISDTYWQTLPRYVMDGDNFGMWSYIDYQDGWSQSWIRNVGAYSDVCHKNGVQNSGGVVFFDSWGGDNTSSSNTVKMLTEKNSDGSFKYLDKFIKYCRYYGVDGVTFNPEGTVPNAAALQDFFAQAHDKAKELGWQFHVCWYGTSQNSGVMDLGSSLTAGKSNWFIKNGKDVCDVYFLNYDWHMAAATSVATAERLRAGSTNNLFAGYDIQGNWMGRGYWTTLKGTNMSIVFWGNHTTDMIYQNSTEMGSADEGVQKNYLIKQEQVFSGGNRNPANTPAIINGLGSSSTAAMKKFHGVCSLMPARSSLQELPFVTRFSLGNGKVFRSQGEETFKHKWYSLSSQDYLPTWRWWITDESGSADQGEKPAGPKDPVLSANDIEEDEVYYIYTDSRGGLTVNSESATRLYGTNESGVGQSVDRTNKLQHFKFVKKDGKVYLYSVATGKYVSATAQGTLTAEPKDPILFTGADASTVRLYFNSSFNINLGGSSQLIIDNWSTKDAGNSFHIRPISVDDMAGLEGLVECGFTFDDSWYAGSCMQVKGESKQSTVRLFKTNFNVSGSDKVNLIYKLKGGKASHARLFWSFVGSESTFHYAAIPAVKELDEWSEFATTAQQIGMTGNVALIGLAFDDTDANYEMLVGEFGIVPQKSFSPVKPTITKTQFLERNYDGVSYKLIWDCGKSAAAQADPYMPTYNEDVDTWYFEVYSQAEGCEPVLDGVTTSWAHYVVGAYAQPDIANYRFGVRAVAPDGRTASDIAWSEWTTAPATFVSGVSIDKPVIKAGEEFTVFYTDPLHPAATKWRIVEPSTGADLVTPVSGTTSMTCSINTLGTFDVVLTDSEGTTTYRGLVQISSDATGALPVIKDFTAEKTQLTVGSDATTAVAFDITRLGDGKVSRGLKLEDAYQFRIPSGALPASQNKYSVGFWVKPDEFAHSKYGTNLINKRNVARSWPHNNWGAFWVIVWPQWTDSKGNVLLDDNVISYTMYNSSNAGALDGNRNIHETPFYSCVTDRQHPCGQTYALKPGTWSHVMITYDGSSQSIYFNGKLAVKTQTAFSQYDESPIYIGGSNVYHAGIKGTIDDVQVWHKALSESEVKTAMMGYEGKTAPSDLKVYYTFEEKNADGTFVNHGSGASSLTGAYVTLDGGAGENTSSTVESILKPNNDVLGNATLPGSLSVTTTAQLFGQGFETSATTASGVLTATNSTPNGANDITLTLSNLWGQTSLTKAGYITVGGADGIESISNTTNNGALYNLAGQRVRTADKGVYIQSGKLIVR